MVDADVGGFKVDVTVEINLFPIDPVAHMIRQNSKERQRAFPVEEDSLFGSDALACSYIFCDLD
jgi:hypothetical protein